MTVFQTRWGLILLFAGVLSGCGGSGSSGSAPAPAPVAQGLLKVATPAELEASLKAGLSSSADGNAPVAFAAAQNAGGASTTYTQEPRVDEFDSVRYEDDFLYVAPQRYYGCCFILGGAAPPPVSNDPRSIRIFETNPAAVGIVEVAAIPLEDNVSVQGMYVTGSRLFAITSTALFGGYGDSWLAPQVWQPERLGFRVYDISDPANPVEIVRAEADGAFVDSRRIGDTVYLVSRYTPVVAGLTLPATTAADRASNEAILAAVELAELLPTLRIGATEQPLVEASACFITNEPGVEASYPIITTVTSVSLTDPTNVRSNCYNDDAYGAYVTETSVYLTQYGPSGAADNINTTRIHKFAFADDGVTYRGSGDIPGLVWRGGQVDFRMSEAAGQLRVMTSTFTGDVADRFDHALYILEEDPLAPALDVIGSLPNANRPTEIGKPNEDLFAVRFVDDRAYAVTFERIDPLYVIDLSDATDPQIAAELEVLGFSDFLHPVTDSLLLGIGASATGGLKLELFDVSVLTQPLSRGTIDVGGPGTYSEARHNRYAFAYLAADVDRFAIPVEEHAGVGGGWLHAGVYEYEIRDKTMPALATLVEVGRKIVTRFDDPEPRPYASRTRSFINQDALYFVRDDIVWTSRWSNATSLVGPQ